MTNCFDLCNTKTDIQNAFNFFFTNYLSLYSYLVEVLGWDYTGIRQSDNGFFMRVATTDVITCTEN